MSAAVKYRLQAHSRKYNDVYRVDILEEGFSGYVTYKNIGANKLRFEKSAGIIQLTSLVISIQADINFEYLAFFQYNNRKHPVKLYKNDTLIWSGYLIADSYEEPYKNPAYDVQIVATDGLGLLETYTFENNGLQTRLEAIKYCIDNLGLALEYSISVDFYEDSMNTSRAMLAEAYFYGDIFNGDKCNEVIEKLLPFGTTISQQDNRWLIRRPFDDAEKTHLIYTSAGEYSTTQAGESLLIMGDLKDAGVWPHGMPLLTLQHAWKDAIIKKMYGKNQSFLKNYNFALGANYWTDATDGAFEIRQINNSYYAYILGYCGVAEYEYVSQYIYVEKTSAGENFIFSMKYDARGYHETTTLANNTPISLTVSVMVYVAGYYLTTEGWVTTTSLIELPLTSSIGAINWHELEIITNNIPATGNLTIRLYRIRYAASGSARSRTHVQGALFSDIKVYTSSLSEYSDPEEIVVDILENAPVGGKVIELKPVDLPNVPNAVLMFANGNFTQGTTLAQLWSNNGGDNVLIETAIKNQLLNYYGIARQKLSGCAWRGVGLHLNAIAKHPSNYNRIFIADSGDWEILDDVFNINWIEKAGSATATIGPGGPTDPADTDNIPDNPWILEDGIWGDDGEIWIDGEEWEDEEKDIIPLNLTGTGLKALMTLSPGDTILTLPSNISGFGTLYELSNVITTVPHIMTARNLGYKIDVPIVVTGYQDSFTAIIDGVQLTVIINVTI